MNAQKDFVLWLSKIDKRLAPYVGGKAANLGEMLRANFPIPNGFVITSTAYQTFIKENNLKQKIQKIMKSTDYKDPNSLSNSSKKIKDVIVRGTISPKILDAVLQHYKKLGENAHVAVRSSATSEDSKTASFAGQQATFLNVSGNQNLTKAILGGWASLFTARAMFYRHENKLNDNKVAISLVVQKMVDSKSSGVMFTIDPVTHDRKTIAIEAIYGLGEYIVGGKVTPDHYEVNKDSLKIVAKKVEPQKNMLRLQNGENKDIRLTSRKGSRQKLEDGDIVLLASLGKLIEKHYNYPQDIEWAKEGKTLYIVQTRPVTTINNKQLTINNQKNNISLSTSKLPEPILTGDPASPGVAIGKVKIVKSIKDADKVKLHDILVAPYTNPDYVPIMKKSSAIVTERGGRTSHAAIVSREFGIPAIVGAQNALSILKDGMKITVVGDTGKVYEGAISIKSEKKEDTEAAKLKTKTKVFVNIAEPQRAVEVAKGNVDGIGLLRAEFMVARIGIHPKKLISEGKGKVFTDSLAKDLATICGAFYPRPVIFRTTDFKTNEYRGLIGGEKYEEQEENPMLGYRGVSRYIHDKDVFMLELEAIKYVRNVKKLTNLNIMLPFVRTVDELIEVKKIIAASGLKRGKDLLLYMMAEIPSNFIILEDFIKVGIDGVSIGSNDLTMLVLGVDRDNSKLTESFNEMNKAVQIAIEKIVKTCSKYKILCSICGQAPSNYPELVKNLIRWGIDSVSVAPDVINKTRRVIYNIEQGKR
ncbi:MAG: phosphoenolpyruvate synthase [Patescibacteria group bacterium]